MSIRSQYGTAGGERASWSGGPQPRAATPTSADLERILALPRRPPVDLEGSLKARALVAKMTRELGKTGGCRCAALGTPCLRELRPAQAWALHELSITAGLVGLIGVGHGKTGLDILAPLVLPGCRLAVLLVPPNLREQLARAYEQWAQHFQVPSIVIGDNFARIVPGRPVLHVIPYSILSRPESTDLLERLRPDLIIADEAHRLRDRNAVGVGRFLRYFVRHPETRLCCWSGTLAKGSVRDVAHLSALALGEGSPLPLDPDTVDEWAAAVDPSDWPAPPGALKALIGPDGSLYAGVHARISETRGVVTTRAGAVNAAPYLRERRVASVPTEIVKMLRDLRATWMRPDGEELVDPLEVSRCARELACGFYYRWRFPKGEPPELIDEWFAARKAWHREMREMLKQPRPHMDSPLLLANAAQRACLAEDDIATSSHLPRWNSLTWSRWRDVRDQVYHETEAVWISDYLVEDAAAWAKKHRGIVWYQHEAFGRRVAERAGIPCHGGGPGAEDRIAREKGKTSICASIRSHGTGRDGLQRLFREQLVANPPAGGDEWEQLLGRLHRVGQAADEVDTYVYRHTEELASAIDRAVMQARFVRGVMGTNQILLAASCDFPLDDGGRL